jgi:hypothetical protein
MCQESKATNRSGNPIRRLKRGLASNRVTTPTPNQMIALPCLRFGTHPARLFNPHRGIDGEILRGDEVT